MAINNHVSDPRNALQVNALSQNANVSSSFQENTSTCLFLLFPFLSQKKSNNSYHNHILFHLIFITYKNNTTEKSERLIYSIQTTNLNGVPIYSGNWDPETLWSFS